MASVDSNQFERLQPESTNLLRLPTEIQLMIYEYALYDPALWERRHRDGCDLRPTEEGVTEHPPWIWHRPILDAVYSQTKTGRDREILTNEGPAYYLLADTWKFCCCGRRIGINLLRTNRHIFSLAAPLFWSKSTFCFFDAAEFAACIRVTSPAVRSLLRKVSILSVNTFDDPRVCFRMKPPGIQYPGNPWWRGNTQPAYAAFWAAVKLLHGLEYVAIPMDYLSGFFGPGVSYSADFGELLRGLPRLRDLVITYMMFFGGSTGLFDLNREDFWSILHSNQVWSTFASYFEHFDVRSLKDQADDPLDPVWSRVGRFWFSQDIREEVYSLLLTLGPRRFKMGNNWIAPHADLIGGYKVMPVQLQTRREGEHGPEMVDDEKLHVTFYSLPLSKEACEKSRVALAH